MSISRNPYQFYFDYILIYFYFILVILYITLLFYNGIKRFYHTINIKYLHKGHEYNFM